MQIQVNIKDITTINTNGDSNLNQPLIEVTLECNESGGVDKYIIKFSEQLSFFDGMSDADILAHFEMLANSYIKSSYKGQDQLDIDKNWSKQSQFIGSEFTVDV
jgi:hypothetical protein